MRAVISTCKWYTAESKPLSTDLLLGAFWSQKSGGLLFHNRTPPGAPTTLWICRTGGTTDILGMSSSAWKLEKRIPGKKEIFNPQYRKKKYLQLKWRYNLLVGSGGRSYHCMCHIWCESSSEERCSWWTFSSPPDCSPTQLWCPQTACTGTNDIVISTSCQ